MAEHDSKAKKPGEKPVPVEQTKRRRTVTFATDGANFQIVQSECSVLEIKEMCREILEAFQAKAAAGTN
jgi:hypothetical protein